MLEQSVVSRIVGQLEQRKLVRRKKNPVHARSVHAFLTGQGRTTFLKVDLAARDIATNSVADLKADDRVMLLQLLQRVFNRVNGTHQALLD